MSSLNSTDAETSRGTPLEDYDVLVNLAVFVSGRGSNLRALIESCHMGALKGLARIVLVVSSRPGVEALEVADSAGIDTFAYQKNIDVEELLSLLDRSKVDLIALAGYLKLIEKRIVETFRGRILNIHPALLPKFGGKGMYGINIFRAIIEAGETETGVTVHLVDEKYDSGAALVQEKLEVKSDDTPETLQAKTNEIEHRVYAKAIAKYIRKSNHFLNRQE